MRTPHRSRRRPSPPVQQPQQPVAATSDTTPNRTITIKSPLYEVTLDSKGALATSWILLKNHIAKGRVPDLRRRLDRRGQKAAAADLARGD